ncbi:hypothetical protein D3C78_1740340 [compost metagenome]
MALHRLPPFQKESQQRGETLPVTENLSRCGLNLPSYPGLADAEIARISEFIRRLRK